MTRPNSPPLEPDPGQPAPALPGRRLRYGRALRIALVASAALHVLAFLAYPRLLRRAASGLPPGPVAARPAEPRGVRIVRIVEIPPSASPARPEERPEPEPEPREERPAVEPSPSAGPPAGEAEPGPTAAERLRPAVVDARIWRPVDPNRTRLTPEEAARLRLLGALEEVNDSLAAVEAARRRALDWTYTDGEGNRWGVSPGKLHLGKVTLPLPFGFAAPPGVREQAERRAWQWDDIERGASAGAVRASWKDRARAIRARKEAERQKADTSSVRRR